MFLVAEAATGPFKLPNFNSYACETTASVSDYWLQSRDSKAEVNPKFKITGFDENFLPYIVKI